MSENQEIMVNYQVYQVQIVMSIELGIEVQCFRVIYREIFRR